jgi:hypothetical protein
VAVSYRKRGGQRRSLHVVREFSTGYGDKADAQAVGVGEEARIRTEFVNSGNIAEPSKTFSICQDLHRRIQSRSWRPTPIIYPTKKYSTMFFQGRRR